MYYSLKPAVGYRRYVFPHAHATYRLRVGERPKRHELGTVVFIALYSA